MIISQQIKHKAYPSVFRIKKKIVDGVYQIKNIIVK